MRHWKFGFFISLLSIVFVLPAFAKDFDDSVKDARKAFQDAVARHDSIAIAGLFDDDAKLYPPNADVVQGREGIEAFFKSLFTPSVTGIVVDEKDNVIEERNYRRGVLTDPIYYYYDDKNRLTDIVRFNYKANRLLPDYLFEYDNNDRVIQKITTTSGLNLGYLTWRYVFDERGLKTKEALFNKEKQLQGRIDYSYN